MRRALALELHCLAAMDSDEDRPTRSIAKAATYRLGAFALDLGGVYVITGKVDLAVGYAIAINACAFVGYYVHERIWSHVHKLRESSVASRA